MMLNPLSFKVHLKIVQTSKHLNGVTARILRLRLFVARMSVLLHIVQYTTEFQ